MDIMIVTVQLRRGWTYNQLYIHSLFIQQIFTKWYHEPDVGLDIISND